MGGGVSLGGLEEDRRGGSGVLGDHGRADLTEAEPCVDARHGRVGRGQEHGGGAAGAGVGRERVGDRGAEAPPAAGGEHADPGDLRDVARQLIAARAKRAVPGRWPRRARTGRTAAAPASASTISGSWLGGDLIPLGDGGPAYRRPRVPERDRGHRPRRDHVPGRRRRARRPKRAAAGQGAARARRVRAAGGRVPAGRPLPLPLPSPVPPARSTRTIPGSAARVAWPVPTARRPPTPGPAGAPAAWHSTDGLPRRERTARESRTPRPGPAVSARRRSTSRSAR